MATSDVYIGRREAVGVGIESTPGTAVAPQIWVRWLEQSIQNKTEVLENESAIGVVDRVEGSAVAYKWAEGSIEGKITIQSFGFFLLGMLGSVSTGSPTGGVYPHTFTMNQSSVPKTLTFARSGPLVSERHSYGTIESLEITAETGAYVMMTADVKARVGASSSETVAILDEKEFVPKHVVLKLAATTGDLAAASAVKARSVTLRLERPSEKFDPLGTETAPEFDRGAYEVSGEFVVRMTDTQYETDFLANTIKAMSISLTNSGEGIVFTGSKVRYRELETTRDRDNIVTATVQFFCEYDTSVSTSLTTVLSNTRATYVAA
ncbi:phage tail tube protein [Streptomyces cinereoruber]|uniref:phage tail tube protein n=1 Tax=Streptomyces cinereoruber TaxID=67260 RepID=UPI0036357CCA